MLWWDDAEANSRFGATVDGADRTYYIRGNYNLGLVPGAGPKFQSSFDVREDSCGDQQQLGFGGWSFGPAVGDFNGDGMADVLWRHTSGALQVWFVHGGGGTAEQIMRFSRFNEIAARERFAVAYPQGITRRWNDGRAFRGRGGDVRPRALADRAPGR